MQVHLQSKVIRFIKVSRLRSSAIFHNPWPPACPNYYQVPDIRTPSNSTTMSDKRNASHLLLSTWKVVSPSKMLQTIYQITRCHNTTNQSPYAQQHENFITKQDWHHLQWSFGKWNIIRGTDHGTPQCNQSTYVDVQPMSGFSHRSLVSNSISQRWVLSVPDCMAFLHGL